MPLPKATVPKPIHHWFLDPVSVNRLREILEDPVFQLAAATLMQSAAPSFTSSVGTQFNNERLCWLAGYGDFVRDLQKLTKMPVDKGGLQEWAHIS
jgi:hypothetical protein